MVSFKISQNSQEHLCQSALFNKVLAIRPTTLIKKVTLAQVLSCEFSEIFNNTFFHRALAAASGNAYLRPYQTSKIQDFLEKPHQRYLMVCLTQLSLF